MSGVMIVDGREFVLHRVLGSKPPKFDVVHRWTSCGGARRHAEVIGHELLLEDVKTLVRKHAEKMRRNARRARKAKSK